jgi:hypothetical protein
VVTEVFGMKANDPQQRPGLEATSSIGGGSFGYTLLETLIGLTIFITVAVPFTSFIFKDMLFAKYQDRVTAFCLIDQEIRAAQTFPKGIASLKRRTACGRNWEIRCETFGSGLMRCKFIALKNGTVVGKYWVMIHEDEQKR